MRKLILLILLTEISLGLPAQTARFVIDDDAYEAKVVHAGERLLREHRLVSLESLRRQVRTKAFPLKPVPVCREKLDPPDLCERLRESTMAVGTLYKCRDCVTGTSAAARVL